MFKENINKKLPLIICAIIVTAAISGSYLSIIKADTNFFVLLIYATIAILLSEIITYNKKSIYISIGIVALHVLFTFVEITFFSDIANFINLIGEHLYLKIFWANKTQFSSEMMAILLLSFIVGFSVHILYVKFRSVALSIMGFLIYILCLQVFFKYESGVFIDSFISISAVLILAVYNKYRGSDKEKSRKVWLKYTTPVICIILVSSYLLTSSINTNSNQEFINWLNEFLNRTPIGSVQLPKFMQTEFYSKSGKIGGPAKITDRFAFNVRTDSADNTELKASSIYLRGGACDYFEDSVWQTKIDDKNKRFLSVFYESNDYFAFDGNTYNLGNLLYDSNLYQNQTYVIENQFKNSNVLFTQSMMKSMGTEPAEESFYDKSTFVYGENTRDRVRYMGEYTRLLRGEYLDDIIESTYKHANYANAKHDMSTELIYELDNYYLQIPGEIPESVKELAWDITRYLTNDYEKACAIEKYLKDNYKYDLKPNDVPKGKDLVSYFLFDDKKGYCTYYATAMVMLCRSMKIPTRYVQGYRVDRVEKNKTASVSSANAHAWVEVYIPDFGWVTFDPVSASDFRTNEREATPTRSPDEPAATSSQNSSPTPTQQPEAGETSEPHDTTNTAPSNTTAVTSGENPSPNDNNIGRILIVISALAFAAVILSTIYLVRRHCLNTRNVRKSPVKLFNEFLRIKAFDGYKWNDGETVAEYFNKFKDEPCEGLAELFEKCFYDGKPLSEEEYSYITDIVKTEEDKTVGKYGVIKWLLYKIKYKRSDL